MTHAGDGFARQADAVVQLLLEHGLTRAAKPGSSLYDRLGGIFAIAAVVDKFSDALIDNPVVGKNSKNPQLRDWSRNSLDRLPGLKWMRTLWVAQVTGGPYEFVATRPGHNALGLENAHRNLRITPEEFDEVARVLAETLQSVGVDAAARKEVLAAFAAHKREVTEGARTGRRG